jgi:ubiquinone/menaquinone biosynthesis C-methylase UbiE
MQGTTFYDDHPFDWTSNYTQHEVETTLAPPLASFIEEVPADALVLDIGCGAGRVMSCLAARKLRCIGLDLSRNSVRSMAESTGKMGIAASNLSLPFPDGTADRVISDGVIHHTIDPFGAFAECCRVLKPGGLLYLAVYKPGGLYQTLYRFPGAVIRSLLKRGIGKVLVFSTMMPIYYFVRLAKSRGKTSWHGATNLFYDYFVTPVVDFLSRDKIEQWSLACGIEMVNYNLNPNLNVHSFLLRKPAPPNIRT